MTRCWLNALLIAFGLVAPPLAAEQPPLTRIGFGACAKQDQPQPIWEAVGALNPQLFVMLGDNIYGDTDDMQVLRDKYQQLADQPGFKALREKCQVVGTWDDHDYGRNDAGVEFPLKRESQQIFLDFFGAPADDVRRTREGVYSSTIYGPPGQRVQLILLDGRYFRSPLKVGFQVGEPGEGVRGKYLPDNDPTTTMLGEAQWEWLATQLREPAEIRIIGSGVQVVADDHGWEKWGNFPHERQRFFKLLKDSQAQGVILLSGDRHLAEISRLDTDDELEIGYPLYDITSTSLNAPSGNITKAGTRFANEINSRRVGLTYFDTNFGMVEIDWSQSDPIVRLQIRDQQGGVVLQQRLPLSSLQR